MKLPSKRLFIRSQYIFMTHKIILERRKKIKRSNFWIHSRSKIFAIFPEYIPYASHHNWFLIINRSWILIIHIVTNLRKKLLIWPFLDFKNGVKSIQTAGIIDIYIWVYFFPNKIGYPVAVFLFECTNVRCIFLQLLLKYLVRNRKTEVNMCHNGLKTITFVQL